MLNKGLELKYDMRHSKKNYIFLVVIFILSTLLSLFLPVNELFKGVALTPGIAALFGALFQIFRDQAEFEKKIFSGTRRNI